MNSTDEIADWITAFVSEWGSHGETPTLRLCADIGTWHGGLSVTGEGGVQHRAGSPQYERAFLTALRAVVASGRVEPAFADESQRAAWSLWAAGDSPDPRPDGVLDVPLRPVEFVGPPEDDQTYAQRAGDHLLALLKAEGGVRYSRFYDGSGEAARRLREVCGCTSDVVSAEALMDLAAARLEEEHVARLITLPDRLADGEHDYLIELTDAGRALLEAGMRVRFRDVIR